MAFRNYKLRCRPVAFQKRFRLLELLQPETRPEFDHHASNGDMLQSGMSHRERSPEFHRLWTRRSRVLLRQSGGPTPKTPGLMRTSLLRLIFSPVAFEFSSQIFGCRLAARAGLLLSSRVSSTYKGIPKPKFHKIGRTTAAPLSGESS